MPAADKLDVNICPNCGADISDAPICWLCYSEWKTAEVEAASRTKPNIVTPPAPIQFGVGALLLLITYVAVLCGVFTIAPGWALVLVLLTLPAFIRTAFVARRERGRGRPMDMAEKTLVFLATTGFVIGLVIAMAIAFYATCWGGLFAGMFGHEIVTSQSGFGSLGTGLIVGVISGIIAALGVMALMIRYALKWWG